MKQTYVFDFYNLYIPKEKPYQNDELGIRIVPLKIAEEFEKNRRSLSKPYSASAWKTAKCYIKSESEEEAIKIADLLEFLYSFAQRRSIFYLGWYPYKKGKKYRSFQSKIVEPMKNSRPELIHGVCTGGPFYTRDISLFIDTALKTLIDSEESIRNEIITTIHSYLISHSQIVIELKFLICWIALEKLANNYYHKLKSKSPMFTKAERKYIKEKLEETLETILKGDKRLRFVKKSITRNFLFEPNTFERMKQYLESLDLGFDKRKLMDLLNILIKVRGGLVHHLKSNKLKKEPELIFYLQKIMENVIFRLLGVDKQMQNKLVLHQYNRGNRL